MIHEIKLIQIHKRNIALFEQKKSVFGDHFPVYMQNQLDGELLSIQELEGKLRRRLQALLEKAAVYGISADPSITIEIEDIQAYFLDEKSTPPKFI